MRLSFYKIQIFIAFLASFLCFLAIWEHPLVGDDRHFLWNLNEAGSLKQFVLNTYNEWIGNLFHILLWGAFLNNEFSIIIFKIISFPSFVALSFFSFYLATEQNAFRGGTTFRDFLIFSSILWLALPVPGETIAWLTGSVYLFSSLIAVIYLSYIYKIKNLILNHQRLNFSNFLILPLFLFSFLIGSCGLQVSAAIILMLFFWTLELKRKNLIRQIPIGLLIGISGILLGIILVISAPGNYARLTEAPEIGFLSSLIQFIFYFGGSFFNGGTGNLGVALWLGVMLIILSSVSSLNKSNLNKSVPWLLAGFFSLMPMFFLTYFASPRTTFVATLFFLIAAKRLVKTKDKGSDESKIALNIAAIVLCLLVTVDGFVGWAANKSYSLEIDKRMQTIESSLKKQERNIVVSYIETIPSRLTFMLNPEQDEAYLDYMAKHYGFESIKQDSKSKPATKNPLKNLKNNL